VKSYRVTVRRGPKVTRESHEDLDRALEAVAAHAEGIAAEADSNAIDLPLGRTFEPVQQVLARIELAGPGRLRAGVDVRGDGSTESFTGRVRRHLIEQHDGESAVDALRRSAHAGSHA
jgi:hypothetical protein